MEGTSQGNTGVVGQLPYMRYMYVLVEAEGATGMIMCFIDQHQNDVGSRSQKKLKGKVRVNEVLLLRLWCGKPLRVDTSETIIRCNWDIIFLESLSRGASGFAAGSEVATEHVADHIVRYKGSLTYPKYNAVE